MVVNFSELEILSDFQLPLLSTLEGKEFVIKDFYIAVGGFGQYAVVTLDNGLKYRTSSQVIINLLEKIKDVIQTEGVKVKLVKKNNYYTFE